MSLVDFALGFNQTANKSNISVSFLDLNQASIVKKNVDSSRSKPTQRFISKCF